MSDGVFRVNPGSLLTAFRRLERSGLVKAGWRDTDNNRRARVYQLTEHGRKHLKRETGDWERRVAAITRILEA